MRLAGVHDVDTERIVLHHSHVMALVIMADGAIFKVTQSAAKVLSCLYHVFQYNYP